VADRVFSAPLPAGFYNLDGCPERRLLVPSARPMNARPRRFRAWARLKQSVCRWTLPGRWPEVSQRIKALDCKGLTCSIRTSADGARVRSHLLDGVCQPARSLHREWLQRSTTARAADRGTQHSDSRAAQAGVPNLIAMFGNRGGRSDADGLRTARRPVKGCRQSRRRTASRCAWSS